jgi:hypothetical protein
VAATVITAAITGITADIVAATAVVMGAVTVMGAVAAAVAAVMAEAVAVVAGAADSCQRFPSRNSRPNLRFAASRASETGVAETGCSPVQTEYS